MATAPAPTTLAARRRRLPATPLDSRRTHGLGLIALLAGPGEQGQATLARSLGARAAEGAAS